MLIFVLAGEIEMKPKICMKQVPAGNDVCSEAICAQVCPKAIKGIDVQGHCILSDTCNCIWRC